MCNKDHNIYCKLIQLNWLLVNINFYLQLELKS